MFKSYLKKRAIKTYLNRLPLLLQERYGSSDGYTEGQVKRTVIDCRLDTKYIAYAYALFFETGKLKEILVLEKLDFNANNLRKEIAHIFFNGDQNYNIKAIRQRFIGNIGHESTGAAGGDGGD